MFKTLGQRRRQGGQALVEYILLLVVVIALIIGPLMQLSQVFNAYINALFGSGQYFACLLETGELGGKSSDDASSCLSSLQSSVQVALSGLKSGSSSGSSSGSAGSSSSNSDSSQNKTSQGSGPSVSNANSGGGAVDGGGANANNSGESGAFNNAGVSAGANQRNRPPASQVVKEAAKAGGESYAKIEGGQFDYKALKPQKGFEVPYNNSGGGYDQLDVEKKRAANLSPKDVASTNTRNLRNKEVSIDPTRAPAAKGPDLDEDGFNFSKLLKWFLIAALIIAIIIFVGGQVLQISKGGEN